MRKNSLYIKGKMHQKQGRSDQAYRYYLEAALSYDDGDAMYELANMYCNGEYVHQDYDKAGYYYGLAYERGVDVNESLLIIAGCYWERKAKEDRKYYNWALKYYEIAAEMGEDYGYECLGKVYFELRQYDKSLENLEKINGKNPCGFYYLARMYDDGLGVERNLAEAVLNYKKAIEVGSDYEEEVGEDDDVAAARKRLAELEKI